jgi:hypothetical protein
MGHIRKFLKFKELSPQSAAAWCRSIAHEDES